MRSFVWLGCFFSSVHNDEFSVNHIAAHLFFDVVMFLSTGDVRGMRYTPELECGCSGDQHSDFNHRNAHYIEDTWIWHQMERSSREAWCRAGRDRGSAYPEYAQFKTDKAAFRRTFSQYSENYLNKIDQELEISALADNARFWKTINSRKQQSPTNIGCGLKFNDNVYRNRAVYTEQWRLYLWIPTDRKKWRNM